MHLTLCSWCRENIEKDIERERRKAENPDAMDTGLEVDDVPCISRWGWFCSLQRADPMLGPV